MKNLTFSQIELTTGGGSKFCDSISGAIIGWGFAGYLVGGIAAATTGGAALILAGVAVGLYCAK